MDNVSDTVLMTAFLVWVDVLGQNNRILSNMKIEFSTQRRQMLLFLSTNMVTVTPCANQPLTGNFIKFAYEKPPSPLRGIKLWMPCKVL